MKKNFFLINLARILPAYIAVCFSGIKPVIMNETQRYTWFIENHHNSSFFFLFGWLLCRYPCYRNHIIYRLSQTAPFCSYLLRFLFPAKKDLEIDGEIDTGLVIYHGHGTVLAAHKIGKNFSVYQGVTIGRNPKDGQYIQNPIIGDNVSVYANAVVAGGITIGDNVSIGAGAVVMKDIPSNCVVIGNPCIIKPIKQNITS